MEISHHLSRCWGADPWPHCYPAMVTHDPQQNVITWRTWVPKWRHIMTKPVVMRTYPHYTKDNPTEFLIKWTKHGVPVSSWTRPQSRAATWFKSRMVPRWGGIAAIFNPWWCPNFPWCPMRSPNQTPLRYPVMHPVRPLETIRINLLVHLLYHCGGQVAPLAHPYGITSELPKWTLRDTYFILSSEILNGPYHEH